jgi:hypothetical protein
VLDWYKENGSKYPFRLFEHQRQLLQEGMFEAYNQWIFEAFAEGKPPPFSSNELEKIGHRQNRLTRSYDSLAFQLRFMEMLRRNLARQGELFTATITEIREKDILFEVDDEGFKKWGFARIGPESDSFERLSLSDKIRVILKGFDRAENRFLFSLAGLDRIDSEVAVA